MQKSAEPIRRNREPPKLRVERQENVRMRYECRGPAALLRPSFAFSTCKASPTIMLAFSTLKAASGPAPRAPLTTRYNSTQAGNGSQASYGSATRSTVPPRSTHATYYPGGYGISEGLKRARKPYRVRNILTGSLIMGFATSVYFYSISKVKQDDFSDLAEIRAPAASESTPVTTESDHKHKA